jgi:hypothetical protein
LLSEGKTPEAACNIAVASIGDVSYLLKDLEKDAVQPEVITAHRQRSALFISIAVMLYIMSVVPIILLSVLFPNGWLPGLILMFVFIACATGLLIYNSMTRPRYIKTDDTMVEEFKQWQSASQEKKSLRYSISSAMWAIITAIYIPSASHSGPNGMSPGSFSSSVPPSSPSSTLLSPQRNEGQDMKSAKIVSIVCWLVTALVLIGLVIWLLTSNVLGRIFGLIHPLTASI